MDSLHFATADRRGRTGKRDPNVRIVWIPDAGHLAWIDEPDAVVTEVERFLGE